MHSDVCEINLFKLGMMIYGISTSLNGLDLNSKPLVCKKTKVSMPNTGQSSQFIVMQFGTLLELAGLINLILRWENPT